MVLLLEVAVEPAEFLPFDHRHNGVERVEVGDLYVRGVDVLRAAAGERDARVRSAYLRMFVAEVSVGPSEIIISGPLSALENGLAVVLPVKEGTVPIFDREWCRLQGSNL